MGTCGAYQSIKAHVGLQAPSISQVPCYPSHLLPALTHSSSGTPSPQLFILLTTQLSSLFADLAVLTLLSVSPSPAMLPSLAGSPHHVQSAGHVLSASFSLCSGLLLMTPTVLSLLSTIKALTISWSSHVSNFLTVPPCLHLVTKTTPHSLVT